MKKNDHYKKVIEEGTFEHQFYEALGFPPISGADGIPLVLRITLGDMELLDGFYMSIPVDACNLPLTVSIRGALNKYVLCENEADRARVKQKLAGDPNPDLLDIYEALLRLYEQAEAGEVTISYHINNGVSDVKPTDPVSMHQQLFAMDNGRGSYYLLDLVLEVYDIGPFSKMADDQKDEMLRDFRAIFILYLVDKFGYQPGVQDTRRTEARTLEYLVSEGLVMLCEEAKYSITPRGYDLLDSIAQEAEFYIVNYDIFGDVYVEHGVEHGKEVRFNIGYGDNLIVPVLMRNGVDPYRALFIVALYLGSMDESAPDKLFSEAPFRELFSLITYSQTEEDIGRELLDLIIREGRSKIEGRQLHEARLKHIESIDRRINDFGF